MESTTCVCDLRQAYGLRQAYHIARTASDPRGLIYGQFFFGWVDTPNLNYPPPLSAEFIIDALPRVDELIPALVSDWIGEALNFRLGTNGLNITQIYDQCDARNITVQEVRSVSAMRLADHYFKCSPSRSCFRCPNRMSGNTAM